MHARNRWIVLGGCFLLFGLSACGGGGGTDDPPPPVQSDPDFVARAAAASLSDIRLLEGHVAEGTLAKEVDMGSQRSGERVTVDIAFSVDAGQNGYVLTAFLVPAEIVQTWKPGDLLGDVVTSGATEPDPQDLVELGAGRVDSITPGQMHLRIPVELPVLAEDRLWRIVVTPNIDFLTGDRDPAPQDLKRLPLLVDDQDLRVRRLETTRVELVEQPTPLADAAFTRLEVAERFDAKGVSVEPVFQTSISVDVTSFQPEEELLLSMDYVAPGGARFAMRLLEPDQGGSPLLKTQSRIRVPNAEGAVIRLPVVAHAPLETQKAMLKQAIPIHRVGRDTVPDGRFELSIVRVTAGQEELLGEPIPFLLPMVSQDSRAVALADDDLVGFSVLRAGSTSLACLSIPPGTLDIDSGKLPVDTSVFITVRSCDVVQQEMRWRHDNFTQQFINEVTDSEGNSYCLTGVNETVNNGNRPQAAGRHENFFNLNELKLERCAFHQNSPGNFEPPGTPTASQAFEFDGDKVMLTLNGRYIRVSGIGTAQVDAFLSDGLADATDIFTNANGSHVDSDGRMFYAGKFDSFGLGDEDFARVDFDFGGEAYLDYLPIIGTTAQGGANLSITLLGQSFDLVRAQATHQRYLSKMTSPTLGNPFPVEVGDGAEARFEILGLVSKTGEIRKRTVTSSFVSGDQVADALGANTDAIQFEGFDFGDDEFDKGLFSTTFVVFVVPVTIDSGVRGSYSFKTDPDSSAFGISLAAQEKLALSGYLDASVNAVVGKVTISGTVEFISQTLDFTADGGFSDRSPTLTQPRLGFDLSTALDMELELLKGEVKARLSYWTPWGKRTRNRTLYTSGYLFDNDWSLFSDVSSLAEFEL